MRCPSDENIGSVDARELKHAPEKAAAAEEEREEVVEFEEVEDDAAPDANRLNAPPSVVVEVEEKDEKDDALPNGGMSKASPTYSASASAASLPEGSIKPYSKSRKR